MDCHTVQKTLFGEVKSRRETFLRKKVGLHQRRMYLFHTLSLSGSSKEGSVVFQGLSRLIRLVVCLPGLVLKHQKFLHPI
jgi:hypothetical protein